MFKIVDIKDDENSWFNSIILGLNSIKNNKVNEKSITLLQNMRDNLSNENTKTLFILSLKNYLNRLKVDIVNSFLMKLMFKIFKKIYILRMILKTSLIFKIDLVVKLHIP